MVARTAGCRYSSSASVQGNLDAQTFPFGVMYQLESRPPGKSGSLTTGFQTREGEFAYLLKIN